MFEDLLGRISDHPGDLLKLWVFFSVAIYTKAGNGNEIRIHHCLSNRQRPGSCRCSQPSPTPRMSDQISCTGWPLVTLSTLEHHSKSEPRWIRIRFSYVREDSSFMAGRIERLVTLLGEEGWVECDGWMRCLGIQSLHYTCNKGVAQDAPLTSGRQTCVQISKQRWKICAECQASRPAPAMACLHQWKYHMHWLLSTALC